MAMKLITTNTSSNAASSSFTSDIDSTYKLYIFKWYDVNPATDNVLFRFQANASSQSGYNETITSSTFQANHTEDDSGTPAVSYYTGGDQAQGTAAQIISGDIGNGGDESCAGELYLFNPSNTTYVKHFYSRSNTYAAGDSTVETFASGYLNVAAAITNIQFTMASGNMDGTIKMYGVG